VEINEKLFSDEIKALEAMEKRINKELKEMLGVTAKVTLVESKTIERSMGKAKRVIDKRKM
jgi:phenylacetate-CoA ligase